MHELRQLGFDPVYTDAVFARDDYLAGGAELRARDLMQAWTDPDVRGIIAARGGYGSVQLLPLLDAGVVREQPKVFVGYSDNTSLLIWLMQACGLVSFHGPMIEGRFARGAAGYDRDSFLRSVSQAAPVGEIHDDRLETMRPGEARGMLVGGTLTQLVASLGHAVRVRSPGRLDPVPRRRGGAAVSAGSDAHAAATERPAGTRLRHRLQLAAAVRRAGRKPDRQGHRPARAGGFPRSDTLWTAGGPYRRSGV